MRRAPLARACALAVVLAAATTPVWSGPTEERFEAAGRAYERGDYARAEAEYRAILEYGVRAFEVYYNLGNACFRQGRLGQAILNYERALRVDPSDPDARHNLEFCRQQIADREEPPRHWIAGAYQAWTMLAGANGEAWILLALYLPGTVAMGVWIASQRSLWRRAARFATLSLLSLALPAAGLIALRFTVESGDPPAIIVADKVEGRSGPGEDHAVLFTVHEGLKVRVRNRDGEWAQVLLPNGLNGWVPADTLETL